MSVSEKILNSYHLAADRRVFPATADNYGRVVTAGAGTVIMEGLV